MPLTNLIEIYSRIPTMSKKGEMKIDILALHNICSGAARVPDTPLDSLRVNNRDIKVFRVIQVFSDVSFNS